MGIVQKLNKSYFYSKNITPLNITMIIESVMERIEKIRKRIKLARITLGYSQDYLGEKLNLSQYAYHKLEKGKTELKVKTLIDIAALLKVKESYLLGHDD